MSVINLTDLTTLTTDGTGIFDQLMVATKAHLQEEWNQNRIRGADYAAVYTSSINAVLQQSIMFLLSKEKAGLEADLIAAQITKTQNEDLLVQEQIKKITAEITLINAQKLKVDADELLVDKQALKLDDDIALVKEQVKAAIDQNTLITPEQVSKLQKETSLLGQELTNAITQNSILVAQEQKVDAETSLVSQRKLTEEAQILDTVTGAASPVTGILGKQKNLFQAQADGFDRDAEQKLAKMMSEVWSVKRTTDPNGTPATVNTGFDDDSIGTVISKAKQGIGI